MRGALSPALPCWQYDKAADRHWYAGAFPAMVGYVQGPDRAFRGVHRTWLAPDGSGKAVVPKPKKMLGSVFGGYLRLCPASSRMLNAEGIETTLSAISATGLPGWAALSEGNLEKRHWHCYKRTKPMSAACTQLHLAL